MSYGLRVFRGSNVIQIDDTYDNYFAVSSASFDSNDDFRLEKDGKMAFTMGKKRFFVKNLANYLSTTVD